MIRRPPRSTQSRSSAASDVYKRQGEKVYVKTFGPVQGQKVWRGELAEVRGGLIVVDDGSRTVEIRLEDLSLIHISEPTRRTPISYAVFCLKKKKKKKHNTKTTS